MFGNLFLNQRIFYVLGAIIVLCCIGFVFKPIFYLAQIVLLLLCLLVAIDFILLYNKKTQVECERIVPKMISLGYENEVEISILNRSGQKLEITIIDELPVQLQEREFEIQTALKPLEKKSFKYQVKPLSRGIFAFQNVHVFIQSFLGLIQKRITFPLQAEVAVFPSIKEMKKFELFSSQNVHQFYGIKKMRRLGHSYEFEQIKNYQQGDDIRSINWKATGHHNKLMVNQYEDEKSQQIYTILDKSRSMKMPFKGMTLLDYSINTCLSISKVALQKEDKAGLITFSNQLETFVAADNKRHQIRSIFNKLYSEKENHYESNYELLFIALRKLVTHRSLLFLFSNFESEYAIDRVLPVLRKINRQHLLVIIFFENSEIASFSEKEVESLHDIYSTTLAQKSLLEKEQILQKLENFGIQYILCQPENLSLHVVNKYLELKSKGSI